LSKKNTINYLKKYTINLIWKENKPFFKKLHSFSRKSKNIQKMTLNEPNLNELYKRHFAC
jgi:hypothetical protein